MSKSILVIDTPKNCGYCPVGRLFGTAGQVECMAGKDIRVNQDCEIIPEWCPLKEVPKQREANLNPYLVNKTDAYDLGYNACIDEILR